MSGRMLLIHKVTLNEITGDKGEREACNGFVMCNLAINFSQHFTWSLFRNHVSHIYLYLTHKMYKDDYELEQTT